MAFGRLHSELQSLSFKTDLLYFFLSCCLSLQPDAVLRNGSSLIPWRPTSTRRSVWGSLDEVGRFIQALEAWRRRAVPQISSDVPSSF